MKKIISLLVITTIVFSMVASLNITTASAATQNLYEFKYLKNYTNSSEQACADLHTSYNESTDTYGGTNFQISKDDTKYRNVTRNDKDSISDEPYLNMISSKYIWNRVSIVNFTKDVLDFSFEIRVPKNDLKSGRTFYFGLAKQNGEAFNNNNYGQIKLELTKANGSACAATGTNAKALSSKTFTLKGDVWYKFNIRVFTHIDGKILFGVYKDDILHYLFESTNANIRFDDIGINQAYFVTYKNTYIRNMRLDLEDYDASFATDVNYLSNVNFTHYTVDNTYKSVYAAGYGDTTKEYVTSGNSDEWFWDKNDSDNKIYKNVDYTTENGALKVTLTPSSSTDYTHASIQNFRKDITSYFPEGSTKYMQVSYDVKSPAGFESAEKSNRWQLGIDTSSANTNKSVFAVTSRMMDNKIWFDSEDGATFVFNGDETTRKSVVFDEAKADTWYRIFAILKIENSGSAYKIHADGYVMDLDTDNVYKIYECDEVVNKLSGTTDGLVLTQQRTDIKVFKDAEQTPVVVYYDNMSSRISDNTFAGYYSTITDMLPLDAGSKFDIELNCYDKTNVVARARDVAGIGSKKLILAAYDGNKLVDIIVSTGENITDPDKGIVELNMNIDGKNVKKLKAFFFDAITTCKPLATAPELEVK